MIQQSVFSLLQQEELLVTKKAAPNILNAAKATGAAAVTAAAGGGGGGGGGGAIDAGDIRKITVCNTVHVNGDCDLLTCNLHGKAAINKVLTIRLPFRLSSSLPAWITGESQFSIPNLLR